MSSLKDRLHLQEHVAGVEAMPTRDDRFAARLRGFGSVGILAILIILAGNFVIAPLSAILVLVWAGLSHTPLREIGYVRPKSVTHPGSHGFPDATFDFLFAKNLTGLQPSVTQTNTSDHWPVTREFRLR
jgi:hypothetical protein